MPGLPCAMVETAYVALSPVRRFPVATVALRLPSDAPSGWTGAPPQDLTPDVRAPRPHDFAVRGRHRRSRARWSLTGTPRPATASGANAARVHRPSPHEPWRSRSVPYHGM